jgi:hypothetical protein
MTGDSDAFGCPVCNAALEQDEREPDVLTCSACCTRLPRASVLSAASYTADIRNPLTGARLERLSEGFRITATMDWVELFIVVVVVWGLLGILIVMWIAAAVLPDDLTDARMVALAVWLPVFVALSAAAFRGRLRITLHRDRLTLFTAVCGVGWKSTHRWSSFRTIYEERSRAKRFLTLKGEHAIYFGSLLSERRRHFVLQALRAMLAERSAADAS